MFSDLAGSGDSAILRYFHNSDPVANKTKYETKEVVSDERRSTRWKKEYAGNDIEQFKSQIKEAAQWAKKSKSKVWLRTKEGTEKTIIVLNAAKECRDHLRDPEADSFAEKFSALATELGNELYYKVSIIT